VIELLAVIAIVLLLAGLLLPALSGAKFQAKKIICKNNLRQIGIALQIYVTDFQAYPPFRQDIDGEGLTSTQLSWDQFLEPVLFPNRKVTPFLYALGTAPTARGGSILPLSGLRAERSEYAFCQVGRPRAYLCL